MLGLVNLVQHSVLADSDTALVAALQFQGPGRKRILRQLGDDMLDALVVRRGNSGELSVGSSPELKVPGHSATATSDDGGDGRFLLSGSRNLPVLVLFPEKVETSAKRDGDTTATAPHAEKAGTDGVLHLSARTPEHTRRLLEAQAPRLAELPLDGSPAR
jgi:hypothetical protein